MPVEPHGPQIEHCLHTGFGPAHPGLFQAISHQICIGSFDDSRANRLVLGQALVVAIYGRLRW